MRDRAAGSCPGHNQETCNIPGNIIRVEIWDLPTQHPFPLLQEQPTDSPQGNQIPLVSLNWSWAEADLPPNDLDLSQQACLNSGYGNWLRHRHMTQNKPMAARKRVSSFSWADKETKWTRLGHHLVPREQNLTEKKDNIEDNKANKRRTTDYP